MGVESGEALEGQTRMRKLNPGDKIGGWTLIRYIASGGNGTVWEATHSDGRHAAFKFLRSQFQNPAEDRYKRFQDEAIVQARLTGRPGILPLIDSYVPDKLVSGDFAWIATALATPLAEALEPSTTLEETVEVIAAIASCLAGLHEEGLCHRDVKPNNLFRHDGNWALGDFGLVDYPDKGAITGPAEKVGPAYYIAPEMLNEARDADGRKADVYSLAKTLWVLASRQTYPLPGEQPVAHRSQSLEVFLGHPKARFLDRLIERATKLDPALRLSMRDVVNELEQWLKQPSPSNATPSTADLASRIRDATEPMRNANTILEEQVRLAQPELPELMRAVEAVSQELASNGLGDGRIHEARNVWHLVSGPSSNRLAPTPAWEHGYHVMVQPTNSSTARILFTGVTGMALFGGGRLEVFSGFVLTTPQTSHSRKSGWNVKRVEVGTAGQQEAAHEVAESMKQNLRAALEEWLALISGDTTPRSP